MRTVSIVRQPSTDEGTFGTMTLDTGDRFITGELPWRFNQKGISCIPTGEYECSLTESPKFGNVYEVLNVKDRSHILIHKGNWCGDKTRNYRSDVLGCIIIGTAQGWLSGQQAVTGSSKAFDKLMTILEGKNFKLRIE